MSSARGKAEQAQMAALKSQSDADKGRIKAQEYDPNFLQPGIDIMKKEQEQLQQQQQQKQKVSNQSQHSTTGQQQSTLSAIVEPHYQSAISVSKSILSRVGLGGGDSSKSESTGLRNQSILASALAGAAAETVLVGGGTVAAAAQKGGNTRMPTRMTEVSSTVTNSTSSGPDVGLHVSSVNGRVPSMALLGQHQTTASRKQADTVVSSLSPPIAGSAESRFSQLLNPSVIDDHFDQYTVTGLACSRPTGLGGYNRPTDTSDEAMPSFSYDNVDRGNASGPFAAASDEHHRPRQHLQRRKTLPGGHAQLLIATGAAASVAMAVPSVSDGKSSSGSGAVVLRRSNNLTLPTPVQQPASGYGQKARPGPVLSSSLVRSKGADMGSMPDVSKCAAAASGPAPAMTREEVHVLSQRRREELRKLREDAERRHQLDIVLRVGDIKDWCQQRQLLVLVIALNISLATMFFNLLSR